MHDRILAALESSTADYTEIRLEEKEATSVAFRGRELETVSHVIDAGGIVRCLCRDGGWGIATFNNRDALVEKVAQAVQCARAARSDTPSNWRPSPSCRIASR